LGINFVSNILGYGCIQVYEYSVISSLDMTGSSIRNFFQWLEVRVFAKAVATPTIAQNAKDSLVQYMSNCSWDPFPPSTQADIDVTFMIKYTRPSPDVLYIRIGNHMDSSAIWE